MSDDDARRDRPGDQVLPDGDRLLVDDQELLIEDIIARRELGISRYGQGHRPFNGRDTLRDFYEEQLDALVYLRSVVRMCGAAERELNEVVQRVLSNKELLADIEEGGEAPHVALAHEVVRHVMGYVAAHILEEALKEDVTP